ncbi:uncharacterized protein [Pocillopora verrucosa]|uniref:uncharacterized protein n=1 Tax=Pocillopora verrucosa TaxID=203993 RepID=UPI003340300E
MEGSSEIRKKSRESKVCSRCGKSVINLSRHQKDVHKVNKIFRQVDVYINGNKKAPNRKIKFCPLSPCKHSKKGVFQLHHHLQSNIHKLNPNSNQYLDALKSAPRIGLQELRDHIAKRKKSKAKSATTKDGPKKRKIESKSPVRGKAAKRVKFYKGDKENEYSLVNRIEAEEEIENDSDDQLLENPEGEATISRNVSNPGHLAPTSSNSNAEERKLHNEESCESKVRETYNDDDSKLEYDQQVDKVEHKLHNEESGDSGNDHDSNLEYEKVMDQMESKVGDTHDDHDSDLEYDQLVDNVWKRNEECKKRSFKQLVSMMSSQCESDAELSEELNNRKNADQVIQPPQPPVTAGNTKSSEIVICDSEEEEILDPNYHPSLDSESECSTGSLSDNCSLQERDDILTDFVENVDNLDFLRVEPEWKSVVDVVFERKKNAGNTDSQSNLSQGKVPKEVMNDDESSVYDSDDDDNDDCLEEMEDDVSFEDNDSSDDSPLLNEFHSWLIDVDGGYRCAKVAGQYKSQVKRIMKVLSEDFPQAANEIDLVTVEGHDGVVMLRKWLGQLSEEYQPGTIRSYLMSLRLFLKFLVQEEKGQDRLDTLHARRDLLTSWSSAQRKKVLKRKLEKHDMDFAKLLSSEDLYKVSNGQQRINIIKALGTAAEKSKACGEPVLVNDQTFCEVRDWLITRLIIDNSGRSGIAANITVEEFKDAKLYAGEEDGERYRVSVKNHKTGGVYGAAIVWFHADVYNLVNTYISRVRPKYVKDATDNMFVSTNGVKLTSSQVSTCPTRTFQREGVKFHGRISATLIRKSLASGVHVHLPEDQEQLAALAQHKPQTQAQYYRINDKVRETDIGRRAVRKFITMNCAKTEVSIIPVEWTEEETSKLQDLFKSEIETGNITENIVRDKLGASNLLETHSMKAIVLKVRRLRSEFTKNLEPPTEVESPEQKIERFMSSRAPSIASESAKPSWSKFTDEQTDHLLSLTQDMIENNAVKREVVWERVINDEKAWKTGLVFGTDDEELLLRQKQRLADKVRKEVKRQKMKRK